MPASQRPFLVVLLRAFDLFLFQRGLVSDCVVIRNTGGGVVASSLAVGHNRMLREQVRYKNQWFLLW